MSQDNSKGTLAQVASLYQAVDIRQQPAPLIIGERSNPTGSKRFREMLIADDFEGCLQVGIEQERQGAHMIDLNAAWAGRDEESDLVRLVQMYGKTLKAPLMIDSTSPAVIAKALAAYPGRPIVNSINLEDGEKTLDEICHLVKKYGACVTALTIDEQGMAMDCDSKFNIAKRIYQLVTERHGISANSIFFDPLTFTIGSGDENLRQAAIETLNSIKRIKAELPGCHTMLGLSNISFGLPVPARKVLNAVFLHEAVKAGLDAVIIDPTNCISLESIDEKSRTLALDLLYDRVRGDVSPLMAYIHYFEKHKVTEAKEEKEEKTPEQLIRDQILLGSQQDLPDILRMLLDRYSALDIVNQHLVPAMREVGALFGSGEMLLPFVLQSAEVMRKSVDILEPFMDKNDRGDAPCILLATVQGDVHDIGKNLVNIILSNNGYRVIDLGIKVTAETIIETVLNNPDIDIICLSGLLVKSAMIMQESMGKYKAAGLKHPILLGGAALTRKFVAQDCVPLYDGPVVYCRDAFTGLQAIQDFEKGSLQATTWEGKEKSHPTNGGRAKNDIPTLESIPEPPFLGKKTLRVAPSDFLPLLNRQILFRGRWGYRRAKLDESAYQELLDNTVIPEFEAIREQVLSEQLLDPKICYGWFSCYRNGEKLIVEHENTQYTFALPRQKREPGRSLVDFFRTEKEGKDCAGFFVVTLGEKFAQICQELYAANKYHEYLLLHGFGVETAEALAQYTHNLMREEMQLGTSGQRYSFGYSACPDLELQKPLLSLLKAEEIGVKLSSSLQMTPELSVSALVIHHPQAHYFVV
ncbi:MAG: dihydropteroate synthase [Proteobacteria bacterium]|nr:dihydropteroate synthase [Pseudomonadota bacterium]MBU1418946.1 dihydropteroate synthase [Pseudomonadota bacterium]MBU1453591.1 dihydropteroate synthase [Pseudomonadota bacterium]